MYKSTQPVDEVLHLPSAFASRAVWRSGVIHQLKVFLYAAPWLLVHVHLKEKRSVS
jgi:hypothetical protein